MSATGLPTGRTIIGPLTTTFTPPATCSIVVAGCASSCSYGQRAQQCYAWERVPDAYDDATKCWPPASPNAPTPQSILSGWGFYSPGLVCPAGYTSACSATAGGSSAWTPQFPLVAGETAVGCCPRGFACNYGSSGQSCQSVASTRAVFAIATCSNGNLLGPTSITIPTTVVVPESSIGTYINTYAYATYEISNPMIDIRWQRSDLPASDSGSAGSPNSVIVASTSPITRLSPTTVPVVRPTSSGRTSNSSAPPSSSSSQSGLSTGAKAGLGIAIGVVVIILILGVFFFLRRKRARHAEVATRLPNDATQPIFPSGSFFKPDRPEMQGEPIHEMADQRKPQELQASPDQGLHELEGDHFLERVREK